MNTTQKQTIKDFIEYARKNGPDQDNAATSHAITDELESSGGLAVIYGEERKLGNGLQGTFTNGIATGISLGIAYAQYVAGAKVSAQGAAKAASGPTQESIAEAQRGLEALQVEYADVLNGQRKATAQEAYEAGQKAVALLRNAGDIVGADELERDNESLRFLVSTGFTGRQAVKFLFGQ